MIAESMVFGRAAFHQNGEIWAVRTDVGSVEWIKLFLETNLIYGLELLDIVLTTADSSLGLDNKNITYYIDNNNAISDLVKADSKRIVISILARLFRALVARRGITPWFERAGSKKNIADLNPPRPPARRPPIFDNGSTGLPIRHPTLKNGT